ncbi:hypothetical protein PUN28_002869 [Cardiocondyla obscurior]|uniref:Uncharacterized protein n=1 Tax=Cardiocondyla obscurior TaxID=286306 RepID=A0AAW2GWR7_9HYME
MILTWRMLSSTKNNVKKTQKMINDFGAQCEDIISDSKSDFGVIHRPIFEKVTPNWSTTEERRIETDDGRIGVNKFFKINFSKLILKKKKIKKKLKTGEWCSHRLKLQDIKHYENIVE